MPETHRITPIDPQQIPGEIDGIPYFHQRDERWCSEPYTIIGDEVQTIGSSGCVPTTQAMIHAHFSYERGVTPPDIARWNLYQGYRTENRGTDSLRSLPAFAEEFGYELEQLPPTVEFVRRVLGRGGLVYTILRGGAGTDSLATSEAHAVLIRDLSPEGELAVHTSESLDKSLRKWDAEEVLSLADTERTFGVYPLAS